MASLKETKTRIGSVKSTLQITSAMKMVAAAKLHRAQGAITGMLPYQEKLHGILQDLLSGGVAKIESPLLGEKPSKRVAVVAFSSNSSLCGGFNSTAVKSFITELESLEKEGLERSDIDVYAVGRKMAEACRKIGIVPRKDASYLVDKPGYEPSAAFARELMDSFEKGEVGRIVLLYNHYKSNASQPPVRETYLPLSLPEGSGHVDEELIVEPGKAEVIEALLPKVLLLKIYTVVMDSYAAEQAARTVAMQLASDNADELLEQLTLEYNKRRQQAITNELLDIVGGSFS